MPKQVFKIIWCEAPTHESFKGLQLENVSFKWFQHYIVSASLLPEHAIFMDVQSLVEA